MRRASILEVGALVTVVCLLIPLTVKADWGYGGWYGGSYVNYGPPVTYYRACQPYYSNYSYAGPTYVQANAYSQQPMSAQRRYAARPAIPNDAARPTTIATVGVNDDYFEPKTLTVQPGTTVKWENQGTHNHTVTADNHSWNSGEIAPGQSYSATFTQPGTYYYICQNHTAQRMQGAVVVAPAGEGSRKGQPTASRARTDTGATQPGARAARRAGGSTY